MKMTILNENKCCKISTRAAPRIRPHYQHMRHRSQTGVRVQYVNKGRHGAGADARSPATATVLQNERQGFAAE